MCSPCQPVSAASRFEEDSREFGLRNPDGLSEESTHAEPRMLGVIGNLRRSLIGIGDSNNDGRDVVLTTKLQQAMAESSYGLADVQCVIDSSTVYLFGIVKSYFALQMAIQLARGTAATRCITLDVNVLPSWNGGQNAIRTTGRLGDIGSMSTIELRSRLDR